ncbi:MAG: 2-oxoacid:acceptor oxidoreductase family protein [Sulfolobales archaeon]
MKFEILFLSRGGQGAVTASRILAEAVVREGYYAQAIPEFGAERRGAIVRTYMRISTDPIKTHEMVREPDLVVIFSKGILQHIDPKNYIDRASAVLLNSEKPMKIGRKTFIVDATGIALKLGLVIAGWPLVNTAILGSIARITGFYRFETLVDVLQNYFRGDLLNKNLEAVKLAYENTVEVG